MAFWVVPRYSICASRRAPRFQTAHVRGPFREVSHGLGLCRCGAGLAYDQNDRPSAWDCSAILLSTAIEAGQLMAQSSAYAQQVRRRLQGIAKQRSAPSPNRYTPSAESVDVLLEDKELDESLLSEGIVPGADEIPSRTQVVLEELGISFYEIKSEHQPSARGATTRPATD